MNESSLTRGDSPSTFTSSLDPSQHEAIPAALRVTGISKTFAGTRVLSNADVLIARGQVHALVGQNGSGKSTLVKILAGYHDPDPGGLISVNGRRLTGDHGLWSRSAGLRFVHQDLGLIDALNTVDNIAMGGGYQTGHLGRVRWKRQSEDARETLAGLGHSFDVWAPVGDLSATQRTAVAVARALEGWEGETSVLVLDEPTAALPLPEVEGLFELVKRIQARGTSVLYVSHHLDEVFELADRITVLRDGHVVACLPIGAVTKRGLVELITGAPSETNDGPRQSHIGHSGPPPLVVEGLKGALIDGLDLELGRGEVLGIAGIDGSGREELCDLIFGVCPRHGRVILEGQELPDYRPDLAVEAGIGFVPADRRRLGAILSMNLRENLTLPWLKEFRRRGKLSRGAETEVTRRWMSRLRIKADSTEMPMANLSGGNQQKVVLSRWLHIKPKVLLLDCPTQGIDVGAKAEIYRAIDMAAADGSSVLVCSPDEDELERLCSRVIVLRRGRVGCDLSGERITAKRIIEESIDVEGASSKT